MLKKGVKTKQITNVSLPYKIKVIIDVFKFTLMSFQLQMGDLFGYNTCFMHLKNDIYTYFFKSKQKISKIKNLTKIFCKPYLKCFFYWLRINYLTKNVMFYPF